MTTKKKVQKKVQKKESEATRFMKALKVCGACRRGGAIVRGLLPYYEGDVMRMLENEMYLAGRAEKITDGGYLDTFSDTMPAYLAWLACEVSGGTYPHTWEEVRTVLADRRLVSRWVAKALEE